MTLTVLYFAAVRDLVGRDEEKVTLPEGVRTVGELRSWLEAERAVLRGRLSSVRVARNLAFATDTDVLAAGDEIALIPPVAGG